ncbi:hypothetical protein D3C75_1094730 [compost metagenome]
MNDLGHGPIKMVDGQLRDDLSRLWCGCGQPAIHQVPDEQDHHRFQCMKCSAESEAQS